MSEKPQVNMTFGCTLGRELARRLRAGENDPATLEAAAISLVSLAELYEKCWKLYEKCHSVLEDAKNLNRELHTELRRLRQKSFS